MNMAIRASAGERGRGRPGRVLIIVQNLPVPFDRRVWLEATTLTDAGYEVSVICPKARGYTAGHETIEGVEIYRYTVPVDAQSALGFIVEFLWCFVLTWLLSLRVAVAGRGFDVIHACNPPETFWALALFWRPFGKRFLFDHHDLSPEMYVAKGGREGGFFYRGLLALERATFATADVVITTNESHKRVAVKRGGRDPDDVYVVRSGPDLARFRVHEPDPSWKQGRRWLIVYLGEMCLQDGVERLLDAVSILRDQLGQRDVHCVLVGGGPHQPEVRQHAKMIGIDDSCTFTGRVSDEDLCRILSSADVAVDPTPKTPWSDQSTMNKIMEYMYFGLPIVCFDLAESRVSGDGAALYAESTHDMAERIVTLMDAPDARAEMSRRGQARVREELAWEYSVPPLLAAYERVAARPKGALPHPVA